MPVSVVFPKFNLERTSGEIASWSVSDGDYVSEGDELFVVEDDKAAVEVESTATGFISGLAEVETEIDVGTVVAQIYDTKEEIPTASELSVASQTNQSDQGKPAASVQLDAVQRVSGSVNPTPLARSIARKKGLSLDGLVGSGPRGRIQKRDVLARLEQVNESDLAPSNGTHQASRSPGTATILNSIWFQKGEGLPVVLVHGFAGDSTSWSRMLYGARYTWPAIAVDLPCHGLSPLQVPSSLDSCAADIEETLINQGVTEAVIAAHSLGGAVAARLATRGNVRVHALCLYAPAGLSPEINPGFLSGMRRARSKESILPWLQTLVYEPELITEAFWERVLAARDTDQKLEALDQFASQFFPDETQRFNILGDLAELQIPVRIIFGRQDRILDANCTRDLPGNVALHLWDQCGHMPHFEHRKLAFQVLEEVRRSC